MARGARGAGLLPAGLPSWRPPESELPCEGGYQGALEESRGQGAGEQGLARSGRAVHAEYTRPQPRARRHRSDHVLNRPPPAGYTSCPGGHTLSGWGPPPPPELELRSDKDKRKPAQRAQGTLHFQPRGLARADVELGLMRDPRPPCAARSPHRSGLRDEALNSPAAGFKISDLAHKCVTKGVKAGQLDPIGTPPAILGFNGSWDILRPTRGPVEGEI